MKTLKRFVVGIVALAALLVAAVRYLNPPLPDTAAMRTYFDARRAAFERRHAEVAADLEARKAVDPGRNDTVGYAFLLPYRDSPTGVIYITHTRGFGVGIHGTGVARLDAPPQRLYPSLDAMRADARAVEGFVGFAPLVDDWYFVLWEAD